MIQTSKEIKPMKRILLIDDEELIRLTLEDALEYAGYEVETAVNGEDGYQQQKAKPFDIIITDILMPVKEGIQTIKQIHAEWPDTPIIAISGGGKNHNTDYLNTALEIGARQVLSKPFTEEDMLDAINRCFEEGT
jgi:YesN/AraC family two-component response regulator